MAAKCKYLYAVYDLDDVLIMVGTSVEIAEAFNVARNTVNYSYLKKNKFQWKYTIERFEDDRD